METIPFGTLEDGKTVRLFVLKNRRGLEVSLCEYGALVTSVVAPDHAGVGEEITLGKPDLSSWLDNPDYLGATVGRYGNRIANGRFTLDGQEFFLPLNDNPGGKPCHLHGGSDGFSFHLWTGKPVVRPDAKGVCFTLHSEAGHQGYPGNLTARVTYWLTEDNRLIFEATATTDAPTPVNLINHNYLNLSGDPTRPILDHELQIFAQNYLPTDSGMIPTGEIASIKNTPLDFSSGHRVGDRINDDFPALKIGHGYDHCFVLDGHSEEVRPAAVLSHPESGRILEVSTNQPGLQFYSGNFLSQKHTGLCLEAQAFPDSPNQPDFPNTILRPGQTYRHLTEFRFKTVED